MKKFHAVFFCFLIPGFPYAQTISGKVEQNSPFVSWPVVVYNLSESKSFFDGNSIIRIENPGIKTGQLGYTIKYGNQKHAIIIRKFDEKGNEILVNKIEDGKKNFGPLPAASIEFDNKILLFYSRYEGKDSMKIYSSEIDKTNLKLKNSQFLFSYTQNNVGLLRIHKFLDRRMLLRKSPDESKLLLIVQGEEKDYFSCVFGNDFAIIRKRISTLPVSEDYKVIDAIIENNGNSILLSAKLVETMSHFTAQYSDMYAAASGLLIQKSDNSEKFINYNTIGSGTKPCNITFKISNDNSKTYMFGDYKESSGINGIWLASIKTDEFKISEPTLFAYSDNVKKGFRDFGFDMEKKASTKISRFSLAEFDNGDIAICGYPIRFWWKTGIKNEVDNDFFDGPLLSASINKESRQCNFSLIPRSINDRVIGDPILVPYRDKLIIFYNDYDNYLAGDSLRANGGKFYQNERRTSLGYVILNKDGAVERKALLINWPDVEVEFNINNYLELSGNKLLIPSIYSDKKDYNPKTAIITID